jgi:hypothetical protein
LQHIFNKEEAARTAAAIINLALHTDNTLNFAFDCIGDNRQEENQNPQTKDASVKTKKRVPSFSSFPIKPNRKCKS